MLRMPAPWEQHAACWMIWPCRLSIWPNYDATSEAYAAVVNAIADYELVNLVVSPSFMPLARRLCSHRRVNFIEFANDDSWARDIMPVFVINGRELELVNWDFNSWGEKFIPYERDVYFGRFVVNLFEQKKSARVQRPGLILEGGAVHSNGAGILLTTASSVLASSRNIRATQFSMEQAFNRYLGVTDCLWFEQGLLEDADTDGHVDNVATFVDPQTVLMQAFDYEDKNYSNFLKNKQLINDSPLELKLITVPQPDPVMTKSGQRLALSYINCYMANGAVIFPTFNQPGNDQAAKEVFQSLFPRHDIVGVPALDIVVGGGGIHCITYEEPFI